VGCGTLIAAVLLAVALLRPRAPRRAERPGVVTAETRVEAKAA
jgi:hypothetical protein